MGHAAPARGEESNSNRDEKKSRTAPLRFAQIKGCGTQRQRPNEFKFKGVPPARRIRAGGGGDYGVDIGLLFSSGNKVNPLKLKASG
jgi:hypothetical protein